MEMKMINEATLRITGIMSNAAHTHNVLLTQHGTLLARSIAARCSCTTIDIRYQELFADNYKVLDKWGQRALFNPHSQTRGV